MGRLQLCGGYARRARMIIEIGDIHACKYTHICTCKTKRKLAHLAVMAVSACQGEKARTRDDKSNLCGPAPYAYAAPPAARVIRDAVHFIPRQSVTGIKNR